MATGATACAGRSGWGQARQKLRPANWVKIDDQAMISVPLGRQHKGADDLHGPGHIDDDTRGKGIKAAIAETLDHPQCRGFDPRRQGPPHRRQVNHQSVGLIEPENRKSNGLGQVKNQPGGVRLNPQTDVSDHRLGGRHANGGTQDSERRQGGQSDRTEGG